MLGNQLIHEMSSWVNWFIIQMFEEMTLWIQE
jgi:hypothetical protein